MSTPDPTQPSPADQTEVIGQRSTEEWPGDAAATEMIEQTGPAPTRVVATTEPTEGAAVGEGSPPEGATDPFGPPDSYGAPESGYYAASGDPQPFPQSEPTAEAPLGDFDFLPADTYEPDTGLADAPPLSTETVAVPVGSPAPPPPPPPPPPAAPEPPTAVPEAAAQPAGLPPVPVQSQTSGFSAPSYVPPAATVAAGAYVQAQQPAPEPQQPYDQQPPYAQPPYGQTQPPYAQPQYGQQPYAQQPYGYGYGPAADPYAKSRVVAGVLGILLGGLGVHRFYLGYVGIGIAQIAVTIVTFGVGALWGFVEGILYLTQRTGSYSVDATGRPLRD